MSRIRIRVKTLVAAGLIAVMSIGVVVPAASAAPSKAILKKAIL
jgi:hypothetical protein